MDLTQIVENTTDSKDVSSKEKALVPVTISGIAGRLKNKKGSNSKVAKLSAKRKLITSTPPRVTRRKSKRAPAKASAEASEPLEISDDKEPDLHGDLLLSIVTHFLPSCEYTLVSCPFSLYRFPSSQRTQEC